MKHVTIDENGLTTTDYRAKFDITEAEVTKIKDKYKKGVEFVTPENDVERDVAVDSIIAQLVEVKGGVWGKPVKLD